jgi:hypothetical protein
VCINLKSLRILLLSFAEDNQLREWETAIAVHFINQRRAMLRKGDAMRRSHVAIFGLIS